jgi:indole-3-glycerol phosphate synthase
MKTILDTIIDQKRIEVAERKEQTAIAVLEQLPLFGSNKKSLKTRLATGPFGIIAEMKRKSPSAGTLNPDLDPIKQTQLYIDSGAAGISVLTDNSFFGGSLDDLEKVASSSSIPVLRKDFIIDEYQLFEAKAYGADVVLLIAEALTKEQAFHYTIMAKQLGLEVLMECHDKKYLDRFNDEVDIYGINNRNLHLQKTDLQTSFDMINFLPDGAVCISESGIKSRGDIMDLSATGYHGALIGESILRQQSPEQFIKNLQVEHSHVS